MQGEPHAQWFKELPGLRVQRALDRAGSGDRVCSTREDGEATIAFAARTDHNAAKFGDDAFDERIVAREGWAHELGELVPQPRTADHVGQHERHGADRQIGWRVARHHLSATVSNTILLDSATLASTHASPKPRS